MMKWFVRVGQQQFITVYNEFVRIFYCVLGRVYLIFTLQFCTPNIIPNSLCLFLLQIHKPPFQRCYLIRFLTLLRVIGDKKWQKWPHDSILNDGGQLEILKNFMKLTKKRWVALNIIIALKSQELAKINATPRDLTENFSHSRVHFSISKIFFLFCCSGILLPIAFSKPKFIPAKRDILQNYCFEI